MEKKGLIILIVGATLLLLIISSLSYILLKNDKSVTEKILDNDNRNTNLDYGLKNLSQNQKLLWPLDTKRYAYIGYPDIDNDGKAFNCKIAGYKGHEGTDIDFSWKDMNSNISVLAALDGEVLWVFDGRYDRCPNPHADCKVPNETDRPGLSAGYRACTELGPYYPYGKENEKDEELWYWCFNGGNLVVIRHYNNSEIFATRYDHLKNGSIIVKRGDFIKAGQKIAEVGSSGKSDIPHLHFEVWQRAFYDSVDPWQGECGPNFNNSLWQNQTK